MFWLCFVTDSLVPLIFPENSNFARDKFSLNRKNRILRASKLCDRQIYLEPDFEPDLRALKLCGREMSLEPDFKPEYLF